MAEPISEADRQHLDAWSASRSRRWATYWARKRRGRAAPTPNCGGWRELCWRAYWFVSLRTDAGQWRDMKVSSRGSAKRAARSAKLRGQMVRVWSLQTSPLEPGTRGAPVGS